MGEATLDVSDALAMRDPVLAVPLVHLTRAGFEKGVRLEARHLSLFGIAAAVGAGFGREGIRYAIEDMSETRLMVIRDV